ncbi:malonic semialdehyde reductase [Marinicauda algicola]|uniref:Putative NADH dehydrogenase/NAD(P)H nitroreductase E5163_07945 n=1 Tax=Marinicauda algicola TaxID=2029849 RepID=A0A4S2H1B3_9PROT|nr:malonic semialdehyde reductase [Marinicauda algicola]TGY89051.1 malonic semialdehyde reductase [Marinicauda algicola]
MPQTAHADSEPLALEDRHGVIPDHALDQLFRGARTFYTWEKRDVPDSTIHALYDLLKYGPTSANQCPARFIFLKGESKERLIPHLIETNVPKVKAAPVTAIVAWDWNFHEKVPQLFPHEPEAKEWFESDEARFDNGFRNGTLQGAYMMLAARSLGLDCGPMSGFSKEGVDKEFFRGDPVMGSWRSNFLCNLGYGTTEKLFPRLPRFTFDEVCRLWK